MRNLQKDFFSLAKFLNEFLGNKGISSFKGISRSLKAAYSGPAGYVHIEKRIKNTAKFSRISDSFYSASLPVLKKLVGIKELRPQPPHDQGYSVNSELGSSQR
jgi:hypothetical protein